LRAAFRGRGINVKLNAAAGAGLGFVFGAGDAILGSICNGRFI
jgi:hypothetical protein